MSERPGDSNSVKITNQVMYAKLVELSEKQIEILSELQGLKDVPDRWEAGELDRFPEVLSRKLVEAFGRFGLSPEYVVELEKLPANG